MQVRLLPRVPVYVYIDFTLHFSIKILFFHLVFYVVVIQMVESRFRENAGSNPAYDFHAGVIQW
jgi:hypothetical protein